MPPFTVIFAGSTKLKRFYTCPLILIHYLRKGK